MEYVSSLRELPSILSECKFVASGKFGFTAAHGAELEPCAGRSWLAVGDAALAIDPLSSQGLLNALYTGLAAAESADRYLAGAINALTDYIETIRGVRELYRRDLALWYDTEKRWPNRPFWRRRRFATITADVR